MNALKPRPPFQVLIVSDLDRLGRESIETSYAIKQLNVAGVQVFTYLEDREIRSDSPIDALIMQVQAFGAAMEREKARQRTRDAMVRKAQSGHVTGGACFGYRNVEIVGPDGKRSHVDREIEPTEADVVRRTFRLSAAGYGLKKITKQLSRDGAAIAAGAVRAVADVGADVCPSRVVPANLPRRNRMGADSQARQVGTQ